MTISSIEISGDLSGFNAEQPPNIADQMIDTLSGKVRITGRFGEVESAQKHRLRVAGEAFGGPVGVDPALFFGGFDVSLQRCSMAEGVFGTCIPYRWGAVMYLLRHVAD